MLGSNYDLTESSDFLQKNMKFLEGLMLKESNSDIVQQALIKAYVDISSQFVALEKANLEADKVIEEKNIARMTEFDKNRVKQ